MMETKDVGTEPTQNENVASGAETVDVASNLNETQAGIQTAVEKIVSSESSKDGAWRSQLPKDLRDDPVLAQYKTQVDAIRAFTELYEKSNKAEVKSDGANQNEAPAKKYEDKDYQKFYDSTKGQNEFIRKQAGWLIDMMRKSNMSPDEIQAELVKYDDLNKEYVKSIESERKASFDSELKNLWGSEADNNQKYLDYAKKNLLSEEEVKAFEKSGLLENVSVVNLLSKYGKAMSESTPPEASGAGAEENSEDELIRRFFPDFKK